jgi:hypothetical protein
VIPCVMCVLPVNVYTNQSTVQKLCMDIIQSMDVTTSHIFKPVRSAFVSLLPCKPFRGLI